MWDELSVYVDEPNYKVRTTWLGSSPVLVTKMWAEGLTAEQVKPYIDEPWSIVGQMQNRMDIKRVDDIEGNPTFHFMNEMPTIAVYNRSCFVTYYQTTDASTGTVTTCCTSKGNQALATTHAEMVGSNVLAHLVCIY